MSARSSTASAWSIASLALNVVVLVPVCAGLILDTEWATWTYGPESPARAILLAIYVAILIASAILLIRPEPSRITALLGLQIVYKLLTPLTVGTLLNPAVASNLAIAAIHAVTLALLLREKHRAENDSAPQ